LKDTLMPANTEAEQAVLGSILIDPDAIVRIASFLKADDFYQEKNAWIYQAILNLHERHEPADSLTVSDELERCKQLDEVGGPVYIMDLLNAVPTAIHVEHYARVVEKKSALRKLIRVAGQIAQLAYEDNADPDEAGGKALTLVSEATRRATKTNTRTFDEVLDSVYRRAEENARIRAAGGMVSIPFGLKRLDEMTGGGVWPKDGDIAIIAGLPKAGKTTFAIQVATNAARLGFNGLILSLEMQSEQVVEKTMYEATGYSPLEIRRGDILDWDAFHATKDKLRHPNLTIDDSPSLSLAELSTIVRRVDSEADGGLDFICVDYAQLVTGGGKTENRTQELSKISRGVKALAKELGIGVFLIAQLNRDYAKRQNRKPVSSDLEGSSQWEKEASFIVFVHRQEEPATELEETSATIILARSRATETGEFMCGFDGRTSTFSDSPALMDVTERDKWRARLMKQCAAMPLSWNDWQLHRDPYDEVLARARATFAGTGGKERDALRSLMISWKDGIDIQALEEFKKIARPTPEMLEILEVSNRKAMLWRVQHELMPALSDRRFAVMYGPSGRGKTHMARIVQSMAIRELSLPAVWLNWNNFIEDIKGTFNGNGSAQEVWRTSRAPILMLDDPDKIINEFYVQNLYKILDEALNLSGTPRSVILLLNHTPKAFGEKLADFGQLGNAVAQRALERGHPVWLDFSPIPNWNAIHEIPGF
jgi:replicative DNA helicase